MNYHLLALMLVLGTAPLTTKAQDCANVAGSYSGTESFDSTLTFGGISDTLSDSQKIRSITITQSGCTFSYTLQFPGGNPSTVTRTGTLKGNEIVALTGPVAIAVDPNIRVTRNEITSVSGTVSDGQIIIHMVGVGEGTYAGIPGRLDVTSTVVLNGPAVTASKPRITQQPGSLTVTEGDSAAFSVVAAGSAPLSYQWRKDGVAISGATSASLRIATTQLNDGGRYSVLVTNGLGSELSADAVLTIRPKVVLVKPQITQQPVSLTVTAEDPAAFSVVAAGSAPLSYQWRKDGVAISGATGASFRIASTQSSDAGRYSVLVSNPAGSELSADAVLTVQVAAGAAPVTHVSLRSPSPQWPYATWLTAAHTIQDALNAVQPGGTVFVTNGLYAAGGAAGADGLSNRVAIRKPLRLESVNGPLATIIQGAEAVGGGNGAGAVRCLTVATNAVVSGFTLTGGHTLRTADNNGCGGGALGVAGAIVTNCVIAGNAAYYTGGGACQGFFYNCTLSNNFSENHGGGFEQGYLFNCRVVSNRANWTGGGAWHAEMCNCLVTGNAANWSGGVGSSTILQCTIIGNSARTSGGGVERSELYNSIVVGNQAPAGANYGEGTRFEFSCATPNPGGMGNISADPLFLNAGSGDFRLQPTSPCVDGGDDISHIPIPAPDLTWMHVPDGVVATDLDGNLRPLDGNQDGRSFPDIGAFECVPQLPIRLSIAWRTGSPELNLHATPGTAVVVESCRDLAAGQAWVLVTNVTITASGVSVVDLPVPNSAQAFYRARTAE